MIYNCDNPKAVGIFFLTKYATRLLVSNPEKFIKHMQKKNKKSFRVQ